LGYNPGTCVDNDNCLDNDHNHHNYNSVDNNNHNSVDNNNHNCMDNDTGVDHNASMDNDNDRMVRGSGKFNDTKCTHILKGLGLEIDFKYCILTKITNYSSKYAL
jgi:hypothetical protein